MRTADLTYRLGIGSFRTDRVCMMAAPNSLIKQMIICQGRRTAVRTFDRYCFAVTCGTVKHYTSLLLSASDPSYQYGFAYLPWDSKIVIYVFACLQLTMFPPYHKSKAPSYYQKIARQPPSRSSSSSRLESHLPTAPSALRQIVSDSWSNIYQIQIQTPQ